MSRRLVACWCLALLVVAAGCSVNPVTGKSQLDLMGEAQEIAMGKAYYPSTIQSSLGPLEDSELQAAVARVGASLAGSSHRPALDWQFTAVNDPQVNAFALPGGKICITRGLLSRMESEDGMASVLGHEIGHVTARHSVAQYNAQMLAQGAIVLGGIYMEAKDVKNRELISMAALIGAQAGLAFYSREQERQADELGMDYAVKVGYSPQGMIETQKVLLSLQKSRPGAIERMFATHPMSSERLATAEKRVATMPAELQGRKLTVAPYRQATKRVMAERPAWDLANDAQVLLANKKTSEAEAKLAQAVRLVPDSGVLRTLHAASLAEAKRSEAAITEGREGARLAQGVFTCQMVAGELLLKSDPARALPYLNRAEEVLAGVAEVAYMHGYAFEKLKRRDNAIAAYKETIRRDPQGEVGAAAAKRLQAMGMALQ